MRDHLGKIKVPVMLGVGAAFDFHSGTQRWAPRWIRRYGMEWLYRMLTGGPRVFRRNAVCVPLAALAVLRQFWRERMESLCGNESAKPNPR